MTRRLAFVALNGVTLVVLAGACKFHAWRHDYSFTGSSRLTWAIAYLCLLVLASYASGLPDALDDRGPMLTSAIAAGSAALGISAVQLVTGSALLPRLVVFGTAGLVTVGWTIVTSAYQRGPQHGREVDRVVFVGARADAATLDRDAGYAPERPASVVAAVTASDMHPVGRGEEPLVDLLIDKDATVLVLGRDVQWDRAVVAQASAMHEAGIRVRSITDFYGEWLGKLPAFELQRMSLMFDISELHVEGYARIKRLLDFTAGVVGSVVCVVAVPFVVLGNLVANRGPLLYRQQRIGASGTTFEILKFRTMRQGASMEWTADDDPRVTRFGRFLRRTHIDELPQFVNILRGELSIVGPRPEQPQYVAHLAECLPFYKLRNLVRPGLTGWAQVKFGYAGNERDALEKLQYDFYYLQHQSLSLDLRIIARTARSIFGGDGK